MSLLIPQQSVAALRQFNDMSVKLYGIDCTLYNPVNLDFVDRNSVYNMDSAITYTSKSTKVFIVWNPNTRQLHQLGIFTEGEIPVLAYFNNSDGVIVGSYFSLSTQFIPNQYKTSEFEVVDVVIKNMLDSVVLKAYKIAPRRVK